MRDIHGQTLTLAFKNHNLGGQFVDYPALVDHGLVHGIRNQMAKIGANPSDCANFWRKFHLLFFFQKIANPS